MTHTDELDEMIRLGWGDTPQNRLPADWRTRRGPERVPTAEEMEKRRERLWGKKRRREARREGRAK